MSNQKGPITSRNSVPATIIKAEIKANEGSGKVDTTGGVVELLYHESILQDSIKVDYIFADTGNTIKGKSAWEGLPIVGTEDFQLAFEDNNGEKIEFSDKKKNTLIVNKITPMEIDGAKVIVTLSLVGEEFVRNEEGSSAINNIMKDKKISDHVEDILKNFLITEKKLDIEDTFNKLNFAGNNKKPYYTLNWLCRKSIPVDKGSTNDDQPGKTAGFLFWETSEGFHFKSIDSLFSNEKNPVKKRFIFTSTTDGERIPPDYDGKVLEQVADNRINYQDKLKMGAYSTKLIVFDPFNFEYKEVPQTAEESESEMTMGGKGLPKFNKKFKDPGKRENATRTTLMLLDRGSLPSGDNEKQAEESEEINFPIQQAINQGIRRFNQLFTQMQTITIAGDFSLHAGDAVRIDTPSIKAETDNEVNKESGGKFIIADLCHYITPKQTYTKMNLIRDSVQRTASSARL